MIVDESDALAAALDRRLAIDRVLPLDAKLPNGSAATAAAAIGDELLDAPAASRALPASAPRTDAGDTLAARLPAGRVVSAQVVEVVDADRVVAQIDRFRITLAFPGGVDAQPGDRIALRILAHEPTLSLQAVDDEPIDDARADAGVATRWSRDAMQLSRNTLADDAGVTRRFSEPLLEMRPAALDVDAATDAAAAETTASTTLAVVDGAVARDVVRAADPPTNPMAGAAIVLQGPAWAGQPIEILVRRERADEAFDNAALDRWCGEIVIDLPNLGRVVGHLAWSMQGLRIRLEGDDDESAASMRAATPELANALADAALPVLALSVGRPVPDIGSTRRG